MEARLKELEKKANKHSGQGAVLTDIQERVAALLAPETRPAHLDECSSV